MSKTYFISTNLQLTREHHDKDKIYSNKAIKIVGDGGIVAYVEMFDDGSMAVYKDGRNIYALPVCVDYTHLLAKGCEIPVRKIFDASLTICINEAIKSISADIIQKHNDVARVDAHAVTADTNTAYNSFFDYCMASYR